MAGRFIFKSVYCKRPMALVALLAVCMAVRATGQTVTPSDAVPADRPIHGRVLDPARAPLAGARITPELVSGDASAAPVSSASAQPQVTTDQSGEFSLTLEPGNYTLSIAKEGFLTESVPVQFPQSKFDSLEIVLQVAPVFEAVTVRDGAGYLVEATSSATRTLTPLRDVPQSITVVTQELIRDQLMMSVGDAVRYIPGVTAIQGENNRDQVVIRGNSSSADFFVNGVRDDVQYYRDLYNLERVEALKGPNALTFGRGGGGGVINRVTKEASPMPLRELTLVGGSYENKRLQTDFNQPLGSKVAFRLNGMYENSDSFRKFVDLERYGVSPTVTLSPSARTKIVIGYEHLRDYRVADRGIPSFQGVPADVPISTFYGNPDNSRVRAKVNLGSVGVEHQWGRVNLHNRTSIGDYDRGYQNYVPGAVTADQTQVALSAYNNATARLNIFNQTDVTYSVSTGRIRHTLLGGVEAGRQLTDNLRNTGFFNNTATSVMIPYSNTVIDTPITFRQSATDADNHLRTNIGATYLQDQIWLSQYVQIIAGIRLDHFDLQYRNNRNNDRLRRIDNLVSPRAGIVFKPVATVSVYGSLSLSYLPSSGDQFSSLTTITQQVKPEKFTNYEAGVKWDIRRSLSLTTAVYRLDRTNTRSTDPNDPTRIVQTGSQRSNGYELGVNGRVTRAWTIAGGYAYQDTFVSSATASARAGAQAAQVPHHTFSLWNNYRVLPRLGAGLGVLHRADMFAAIDDTVTLPGYTRADAAVFFSVTERVRLQANVENLFNTKYFVNADGNNNISPGSSRAVRVALIASF